MQSNDRQIDLIQNDLHGAEQTRRKARLISIAVALAVLMTLAGAGWAMASRQSSAKPASAKKFTPSQATAQAPLRKVSSASKSSKKDSVRSKKASATRKAQAAAPVKPAAHNKPAQTFSIAIGDLGYNPSKITASSSSPITLKVAKGEGCASGFLIKKLGVNADNSSKAVTVGLGKLPRGTYRYTCGMEMVEGTLVVD